MRAPTDAAATERLAASYRGLDSGAGGALHQARGQLRPRRWPAILIASLRPARRRLRAVGFSIFDLGQFRLGPVGKLLWPRKGSSDLGLNGLGDIGYTLQVGGFVEFWPVQWLRLRTEVRQGFGGENGVTGDLSADVVVPVGPVTLSGGPRLTLQSSAAVSPYFSITPTQSIASGLPVYSAAGGVYSYGGGVQARYFWSEQWATHAFLEYERLTGDAANSPLVVQRGSSNQFMYGLGTTYSFNMPSFW